MAFVLVIAQPVFTKMVHAFQVRFVSEELLQCADPDGGSGPPPLKIPKLYVS